MAETGRPAAVARLALATTLAWGLAARASAQPASTRSFTPDSSYEAKSLLRKAAEQALVEAKAAAEPWASMANTGVW